MLNNAENDALLTLAIPTSLEEDIVDFLLERPELASGFTLVSAQGLGAGAPLLSPMERVQGRSAGKLVLIAGQVGRLQTLLRVLAADMPAPHVHYWMTPLLAGGRLA